MLLVIHGLVTIVFILLGILFLTGRGSCLIAGYNTASKAEKEEIDEKKLCSYVGRLMFLFAGCFLVIMTSDLFEEIWLLWLALFFGTGIGGVIFINTGNHLKK